MELRKINWPGLGCFVTAATIVILSVLYAAPWWQVTIGDGVGKIDLSPLDYNANLAGAAVEIPLIWFLNLGSKLTMATSAVVMLIYSVSTQKSFSKHLLGFAYKKPILMLIFFIVMLVGSTYIGGIFLGVDILPMGNTTMSLPVGGATINIPVSTSFTWVFWLAVATAVLALAAKIFDWKVIKPQLY